MQIPQNFVIFFRPVVDIKNRTVHINIIGRIGNSPDPCKKRHMKVLLIIFGCWSAFTCSAQTMDTASQLAASYFKEAALASRDQQIWNTKVYGPMLFVEPESRIAYANMPDSARILQPDGDIYKGVLPKELMLANTAIDWEGKKWSVVLWPTLTNLDDRTNLLLHESFHRIQAGLGLPERSPTVDHLSSMYGRIYFLLELQALKAALGKPVGQRNTDLSNALLFRAKRQELFPKTFDNERVLEMSEGLAEYTGVILGRPKDSIRPHLYQQIDSAGERKSLIRSCAYFTGPVYGYLLYEKSPGWTQKIDSNSDLPLLISKYYHISLPEHPVNAALARLEHQYNADAIIRSEKQKEELRLATVHRYVDLFTQRPVLTITLLKMGIEFNPNTLFDLGDYGTVYPTAHIKDTWGQLTVSSGGVLMKDWKVITLPADADLHIDGRVIEGKGWQLLLNEHWEMVKVDSLHYRLTAQSGGTQDANTWNHHSCAVVLTYDDAIDADLDNALPVLDSLGLKATFYLIGSSPVVANRMEQWREAARHGHELGNHSLYHPCDGSMPERSWVQPDYDLSKYTVTRAVNEIRMNNVLLNAIDGKTRRTFAYPCGDLTIGDSFFYAGLRKDFVAARGVRGAMDSIGKVNLDNVDCYGMNGQTADQMIALVKEAMRTHTLLVFLFHGVGGGHNINVGLNEHSRLLHFLKDHEREIWIAPMVEVAEYVHTYQQRQ